MSLSATAANASDDAPKSTGTRALAAVPVVLTVLATVLAGLSSSEMTRSMYYRSLAAQNQAKAGSQWAFFQAKRIRGTTLESTNDLVPALSAPPPLDAAQLLSAVERVESGIRAAGDAAAADRVKAVRQKFGDLLGGEDMRR